MKSLKVFSLALLAVALASGVAHAKGGMGGMGGMGMGNGSMASPDTAQRKEMRTQSRDEKRIQTRDGSQAGNAQREQIRNETREQIRSGGDAPVGQ